MYISSTMSNELRQRTQITLARDAVEMADELARKERLPRSRMIERLVVEAFRQRSSVVSAEQRQEQEVAA